MNGFSLHVGRYSWGDSGWSTLLIFDEEQWRVQSFDIDIGHFSEAIAEEQKSLDCYHNPDT